MSVERPQESGAFKIAFVGPAACGKTSIINRYHEGEFSSKVEGTVGASFVTHEVQTPQGTISLNIWDTAGQDRYRSLVPMYCRNAVALVVVYDVAVPESFEDSKEWCEKYRCMDPDLAQEVYYVGNKIDLQVDEADLEVAREYAGSIGADYFSTSAKTGEGIQALFRAIAERLGNRKKPGTLIALTNPRPQPAAKGGCCK
jgi:Ras-related protein Rab-5C